ncbi:MAG: hypothetical protein R2941_15690 [Desulfobacterales bacterium]
MKKLWRIHGNCGSPEKAQILLVSWWQNTWLALAADGSRKLADATLQHRKKAGRLIKRRCEVGMAQELRSAPRRLRVESAR